MTLSYRWVIVAVGALMTCVALGAMFSLAVFLVPLSLETGWSRAGISSAMTLNFLVMGAGAFGWGAANDRYGTRIVVLIGSVLLGLALVLASQAQSLLVFQLTYGILVGLAASAFFTPMIAATTAWFDTQRSLAVSLVSAGMGVAPMTLSPFARWLITTYDWRTAMLVIGVLAWVLLIPAALLVRRRPAGGLDSNTGSSMESASGSESGASGSAGAGSATRAYVPVREAANSVHEEGAGFSLANAFRSPQFVVLSLTFFACCAAHAGPIFHMVSYAIMCGVTPMAAVSIYSVEGLAGLGGRLLFGVAADRLGVKPVLVAGLLVQALAIGAYLAVSQLGEFYALALIFGTAYGGVMPLYAVLAREYFGQERMGTVFGAATMVSSLGMAMGPVAGGWVFDTFNNYAWLFIGSCAVGFGAVAIAFTFPPLAREQRLQAQ